MKYELVDLGRPYESSWAKAFIHTQEKDLLIKGGYGKVQEYLRKLGKAYFGKMVANYPHNRQKSDVQVIAGNGLKITLKQMKNQKRYGRPKRTYYELRDAKYNTLFTRVRRMPTRWIKEIFLDVDGQILVATDLLKENGLDFAAQALLDLYHKKNEVW